MSPEELRDYITNKPSGESYAQARAMQAESQCKVDDMRRMFEKHGAPRCDTVDAFRYAASKAFNQFNYQPPVPNEKEAGVVISMRTGKKTKILKDVIWKDSKC